MSGFMAVNVGVRIPGVQSKLRTLAQLPEQLQVLTAKTGEQDGMASLIRRAVHLFDLIMGKVVGSNGFLYTFMITISLFPPYCTIIVFEWAVTVCDDSP